MKKTTLCLVGLLSLLSSSVFSQTQFAGWYATFNTFKLNKTFSIHNDIQLRSSDQLQHVQTLLLRAGLNVHVRKNMTATAGYAFVHNRRTVAGVNGYAPEHRIWEQFTISHPIAFVPVQHRLRLEQRFIGKSIVQHGNLENDGFNTAHRIRYFTRGIIPFNGVKKLTRGFFGALQNEVFVNLGDKSAVNGETFDQNRAYVAAGYRFSPRFDGEIGYLNQYINGRGNASTNNHILQVATYVRL